MELLTERLVVRTFAPEDWRDLHEYLSQEEVVRFEPEEPQDEAHCREIAEKWSAGTTFWAVCLRNEGKMIGHVYFAQREPKEWQTWEIGYVFNPQFHGSGYATEACRAVMQRAFDELGAHRIVAMCDPLNAPSWRLLERLHMRREGHFLKNGFFRRTPDGQPAWHDSFEYAILADEWKRLRFVWSHSDE